MTNSHDIPVLIVGGGPVGLILALDLARRGTRSIVVERDAGTGLELLAKAGTLNERTMEYCRSLGIAEEVANVGFPDDHPRDTIYCTSLNGFLIGRDKMPGTLDREAPPQAAEMLRKCPQFLFDPLVARAVLAAGMTEIRYSTRFTGLRQDNAGVEVDLESSDGKAYLLRAAYVVGCDGAGSAVRKALNIPFDGKLLDYSVSAMIRMPGLERYHPLGKAERYMFIGSEGTWANLTAVDGRDLWRLTTVGAEEEIDPRFMDFEALVRRVLGRDDVPHEILRVVPWRRSQFAAGKFAKGRVALAGDSAHTTSPTGGHGLNTGLGDASDLGWMLDALVKGWGGDGLLAAYDAERRPVAIRNSQRSTSNYKAWVQQSGRDLVCDDTPAGETQRRVVGEELSERLRGEWISLGVGLGYRYEGSPIVVPDGTPEPPDPTSEYEQTARPGHRAPHAWLAEGRSTIDLFGPGFTLLRLGAESPDADPLVQAAECVGLPLQVETIDAAEVTALYGNRLALVRPDGMVAWRGDDLPADCAALVDTVRGALPGMGSV